MRNDMSDNDRRRRRRRRRIQVIIIYTAIAIGLLTLFGGTPAFGSRQRLCCR